MMDRKIKNNLFLTAFDWLIKEKKVSSQKELAEKIGVSPNTITRIKNYVVTVSDDTLRQMDEAFGHVFNMAYFRGESNYMLKDNDGNQHESTRVIDVDRQSRLKIVFEYLRQHGMAHTQKDFADALGKAEETISRAFNGDEKALTNNLMLQITVAFPGVFNIDWLLSGDGEMLIHRGSPSIVGMDVSSYINAIIAAKQETIDSQKSDLATKDALIKSLQETNKDLRARIYELEHAETLKKYPFEVGVSDPTDKHQPTV